MCDLSSVTNNIITSQFYQYYGKTFNAGLFYSRAIQRDQSICKDEWNAQCKSGARKDVKR